MRPLFTDYHNSLNHILLGVIGGFFPTFNYIFIAYQIWEYTRQEDYLLTDLAEYAIGFGLYYLLSLI